MNSTQYNINMIYIYIYILIHIYILFIYIYILYIIIKTHTEIVADIGILQNLAVMYHICCVFDSLRKGALFSGLLA